MCDGISSDAGGCTADRHSFAATTCADVAREWAVVLDKAVIAVLDGPADVGGEARSVRLKRAQVIVSSDMNNHLRRLGIRDRCDVPEFMAAAEPLFSQGLRARIGTAMFDGNPVMTYQDWLVDVRKVAGVIDGD